MSEISTLSQKLIIKKIDHETVNLQITDNEMLITIVGQFDQNLKDLSKLTFTNIFFRGNSITCKGKEGNIKAFCVAIKFLVNKYLLTNIIEKEDILLSVKKNIELEKSNVKSFKQLIKTPRKSVIARSEKQSDYITALKENDIVMSLGPAGTGKSFLAVSVGVSMLLEKKIERVILSRPAVEAGEKLGFLPVISNVPKDHHSLMQLYLDGPKDKIFYIFSDEKKSKKRIFTNQFSKKFAFLNNKTLDIIKESQKNAFLKVLKKKNIPYRDIKIKKFNEKTLGELFSFFILETAIVGNLTKINPFNQPAVEQVKIFTKKLLN